MNISETIKALPDDAADYEIPKTHIVIPTFAQGGIPVGDGLHSKNDGYPITLGPCPECEELVYVTDERLANCHSCPFECLITEYDLLHQRTVVRDAIREHNRTVREQRGEWEGCTRIEEWERESREAGEELLDAAREQYRGGLGDKSMQHAWMRYADENDIPHDHEDEEPFKHGFDAGRATLELSQVKVALTESVKLQTHYAGLLNAYDGGGRVEFSSADAWIKRLKELGKI